MTYYVIYDMQHIICYMSNAFFINSLASAETEPIIPEWFFKTTIVIEPERIEF